MEPFRPLTQAFIPGDEARLWTYGAAFLKGLPLAEYTGRKLIQYPPGAGDARYAGKIDEFRLYDRSLSAAEVLALYQYPTSDADGDGHSVRDGPVTGAVLDSVRKGVAEIQERSNTRFFLICGN